ncbi:DUF2807 domain-containing protein [Flavobacteriaceae bacterium F89]|uniref:DUF2807 domain-containing protein n=1 Tax=Cerina litoralis TaxID=2874477 RepID=A0AAE3JQJ5_9FLAO|nr:DUF2807 domain-containing protein [Cerina litoralis]MCG2460333.1 DUF2807 domain-containing protein [Cerina litoralis]
MRKIALLVVMLSYGIGFSQRTPKIKGNGKVTEVGEALPSFNAVELVDNLDVFLEQSNETGYSISADENLIDVLKLKVEDNTLKISSYYKITGKKKLEITVRYNDLNKVTLSDGTIGSKETIILDELELTCLGYSKSNLKVNASVMDVFMKDNSTGDMNLKCDSLNVDLQDKADARIYSVTQTSKVQLQKNAKATLEGTVDSLSIHLADNAYVQAYKLEAGTIKATLEGGSKAEINAVNYLQLSSQGSSKTYLYGEGKITIDQFLDRSELIKRK